MTNALRLQTNPRSHSAALGPLLLLGVLLLMNLAAGGCQSHPQRVAHNTLGILNDTVQAAIKGWSAHCRTRTAEAAAIAAEGDAAKQAGNATAARQLWQEARAILETTRQHRARVDAAYAKYQQGAMTAVSAARLDWKAAAPPDVTALANDVLQLVTTFTKAAQ